MICMTWPLFSHTDFGRDHVLRLTEKWFVGDSGEVLLKVWHCSSKPSSYTIYLHEYRCDRDHICMTWLPFSYSNLDVTIYRGWRKNDSWAIRVGVYLKVWHRFSKPASYTIYLHEYRCDRDHICMTWLSFSYSNLDVTMYRSWRKNDSWAIRVRYNWKFDIVLQSLRRIQYICMNTDAIGTIFAWRDYHFLIQIWTWP